MGSALPLFASRKILGVATEYVLRKNCRTGYICLSAIFSMKKRILITVKTYPNPSTKYTETVCTSGITDDGKWIRLYPIDFRYKPYTQQFKKYDWIECEVRQRTKGEDPRVESHSPTTDITIVGKLDTKKNWTERKKIVMPLRVNSIEELRDQNVSLALIQPKKIQKIIIEETERAWTGDQSKALTQMRLIGPQNKPLEKIPYSFKYEFLCHGADCKGHCMQIEDWEPSALYLEMKAKYGEKIAVEKVRNKLEELRDKCDLHFYLGTTKEHHHRRTFTIIGLFYPRLEAA